MNPDWLLKHFDQISEAPDAVPRLRRFILDLAVRGKIVPQDPNDEPASHLLKRIQREKHELISQGKIKAHQNLPAISEKAIPFEIPRLWEWVGLAEILIKLTDGTHHSPPNFQDGDFKYITAKNIKPEGVTLDEITYVSKNAHTDIFSRCDPAKGDLLYVKDGATTGVVTVNDLDEPFSMLSSVALMKIGSGVFNRLLVYFLRSAFFYAQMRGFMKGAAITRVTLKRMAPALIPLPPFAEQHRIVAKVDELMALCDELEAAQSKREKRRDRLVTATLHSLENGKNGSPILRSRVTFRGSRTLQQHSVSEAAVPPTRDAARFFLKNLPRLTTRLEHIRQFRQIILNFAIHGWLIPQDPHDEPASDLLQKIKMERQELVRSGRIKQREVAKSTTTVEFGRQIPANWEWVELQEIFHFITDGDHQPPPRAQKGILFLVIGNIRNRRIELNTDIRYVPQEYYLGLDEAKIPRKGKILYTLVGSYGIPILLTDELEFCVQRHIAILTPSKCVNAEYLAWVLESQLVFTQATDCATGIAQKTVPLSGLRRIRVPLPPVSEQQRIVEKLDELMGLCDQLEARLATTTSTRSQLLDLALSEALNGHSKPGTILMEMA